MDNKTPSQPQIELQQCFTFNASLPNIVASSKKPVLVELSKKKHIKFEFRQTQFGSGCHLKIENSRKHALSAEIKVNGQEPPIDDQKLDYVISLYDKSGFPVNSFTGKWNPTDFGDSCGKQTLADRRDNLFATGGYSVRFQLSYNGSSDVVRQAYVKLFSNC